MNSDQLIIINIQDADLSSDKDALEYQNYIINIVKNSRELIYLNRQLREEGSENDPSSYLNFNYKSIVKIYAQLKQDTITTELKTIGKDYLGFALAENAIESSISMALDIASPNLDKEKKTKITLNYNNYQYYKVV